MNLVIKSSNGYLYLLGHLSEICVQEKEQIYPGKLVAKVGNTGHCSTQHLSAYDGNIEGPQNAEYRSDRYGAHLHLQMYLSNQGDNELFIQNHSLVTKSDKEKILLDNMEIVNPFNYMEAYKNEK